MFLWKLLIESGLYLNWNKSGDLPFQDFVLRYSVYITMESKVTLFANFEQCTLMVGQVQSISLVSHRNPFLTPAKMGNANYLLLHLSGIFIQQRL